jgi:hypothetical protein
MVYFSFNGQVLLMSLMISLSWFIILEVKFSFFLLKLIAKDRLKVLIVPVIRICALFLYKTKIF